MKKFLSLLLLSLLFVACNPSQTAKDDLRKFTERIEQKSDKWSDADWDDALMHYSEICQTLDQYKYTAEEKVEIGKLKGRCQAQFVKHSFNNGVNDATDTFLEMSGAIEGFFEGLGK